MHKARTLLVLGLWIGVLPFLGFPYFWKDIMVTVSGLFLIGFSYLLYQEHRIKETKEKSFDNFRENNNFTESQNGPTEEQI